MTEGRFTAMAESDSWRLGMFAWLAAWACLAAPTTAAQEAPAEPAADAEAVGAEKPREGLAALVRVRLPITGSDDQTIQQTLQRARDRLVSEARAAGEARRPVLVVEIAPRPNSTDAGEGSQFERCLVLARFLSSGELNDVKTVAFIPQTIRGHGVLLAIACEEIIMAPEAEIGEAGIDSPDGASPTELAAYQEIAERRRTVPSILVRGMIDSSAEIVVVGSEEGEHFLLADEVEQYRQQHEVIREETLVAPGSLARFTGREGRHFGFVKFQADNLDAAARVLDVPPAALKEDESLRQEWVPIMLEIRGPITPSMVSQFETLLGRELTRGANWIALRIDSAGGNLAASTALANLLADLDGSVHTVAYVASEARGGAALAALACDRLVMHPEATLAAGAPSVEPPEPKPPRRGRFRGPNLGPPNAPPQPAEDNSLEAALVSVRAMAGDSQRSWSLLAATIDPSIQVFHFRHKQTGQQRLMSANEAAELPDADQWVEGEPLNAAGEPLRLTGDAALRDHIAEHTVENFDQFYRLYGFEEPPPLIETNWALQLIEALANPVLAFFLIMIGMAGLYIEVKTAGLGIGAFVASLAFLLFFWSKTLDQTAGWLEALLFVVGLFFILLEVFVLPGFGIFGLGGGAMVIFSLVLASQTFVIPQTPVQMVQLRNSVAVVAAATIGVAAMAMVLRQYLPSSPLFSRILLEPPRPEDRIELEHRETVADYTHLIGQGGTATTDLRPTGKARIADELVDVVAEAEPLDRGTSVVVVKAQANRVVVRAVG